MPPKAKITREMIVRAAFDLVKNEGEKKISARNIAQYLNCSTQPILYYFKSVEEIKEEVYQSVMAFHEEYVTKYIYPKDDILMQICLNYIRFASEESQLFCFLFQSSFHNFNPHHQQIISLISTHIPLPEDKVHELYHQMYIFIHGYASLYANQKLTFDKDAVSKDLLKMFFGTLYTIGGKII